MILYSRSQTETTPGNEETSAGTNNVVAGRCCGPVSESELDVLQSDPSAWITAAAIERHRLRRCRRPFYVSVCHSADLHPGALAGASLAVRTVILIDDYGVLNVVHDEVLEQNVPRVPIAGPCP